MLFCLGFRVWGLGFYKLDFFLDPPPSLVILTKKVPVAKKIFLRIVKWFPAWKLFRIFFLTGKKKEKAWEMVVLTSGLLWKISIFGLFCVLSRSEADESSKCHSNKSPRVVRHLGELVQENYGRPGLSHIFVAGANDDGMKEIEVWMATYAPGSGTPIHRHNCEEVFIVLMGGGTLFLAPASNASSPGRPQMFTIYPNSTFIVPVDSVHQVRNTMGSEDLQVVIVISQPPMKAYVYKDWTTTHDEAVYRFPYFEKKLPATSYPISETDSAIPITSRMDDLQELVIDVDQTHSDELR